jgi:hypothetical protein
MRSMPSSLAEKSSIICRSYFWSGAWLRNACNGYLEYPFEKMTISSFPPISILAKWNSMKEDAREFFSSLRRNSLNATRKPHVFLLNALREAMREMHERSSSSTFTNGDESWMRLVGLLYCPTCFQPIRLPFGSRGGVQPILG